MIKRISYIILIVVTTLLFFYSEKQHHLDTGDYVILVHGLGRTKQSMASLEDFFTAKGFSVIS
jgi:hypothetical protein